MKNNESIKLSSKDFEKHLKKEVGHGTDGYIMHYRKDELIKIYYRKLFDFLKNAKSMEQKIRVYQKSQFIPKYNESINHYTFINNEEMKIKLQSKDIIELIKEKQQNIKRTNLPQDNVYIDGIFVGFLLKEAKGIPIHYLTGLPTKLKKLILMDVLNSIKELMDNGIYHIDLNNSPYSKTSVIVDKHNNILEKAGHSHVLVNPISFKTSIIDLDGKSAIYTEKNSEKYERICLSGLTDLIIEFLFAIDLDEYNDTDLEIEALSLAMEKANVAPVYIDKITEQTIEFEEIRQLVRTYKGKN